MNYTSLKQPRDVQSDGFCELNTPDKLYDILTHEIITDDLFWRHLVDSDLMAMENKIRYLLREYGTTDPCNRFAVGNSIEFILADHLKTVGFRVSNLTNAKRIDICIGENYKLSVKYSSSGDITLHNFQSANWNLTDEEIFTNLILLTPDFIILLTNESVKKFGIVIENYLKEDRDSLKLKRKIIHELKDMSYPYIHPINLQYDKSTCTEG